MNALNTLALDVGMAPACAALNLPRSSVYRHDARQRHLPATPVPAVRPRPALALSEAEHAEVLALLDSERFADQTPYVVYATLLDEGRYLCSVRTMYRVLQVAGQVRERRAQRRHPAYAKPELLATRPNQVWSWDITKLKGPATWTCFHLYVVLDIFSRYIVGWMIAPQETAELAEALIAETIQKQGIQPGTLTLHADRGSSMRSKPVAAMLVDLDVAKTHSRPYVSDDNPYSESQFKTMKYRPAFPPRFGSIEDARAHCQTFFGWYNHEHYHSRVGFMTPANVHNNLAEHILHERNKTLTAAFANHPNRFKHHAPKQPPLPTAVWINPPHHEKLKTTKIL
jgi:putative transposase